MLKFCPQPWTKLCLLDEDATTWIGPSAIEWIYVQQQNHPPKISWTSGSTNFGVLRGFKPWSMSFRVKKCSWNVSFKGSKFWNFFNDWASDEEVKVCGSLQSLRTNTQTNEQTQKMTIRRTKMFAIRWGLLSDSCKKLCLHHSYSIQRSWL